MRITRIFSNQELILGQAVALDKDPSNHISHVLRLNVGNELELFNGDGFSYNAQILSIERNQVSAHILNKLAVDNESPLDLHLFQGVSRGDKMDLTLQKAVELGVKQFTPIITERCGVKLDAKRWQKKLDHWQKVIRSACEQSGRNIIPQLHTVKSFAEALDDLNAQSLFLDPHAEHRFASLKKPDTDLSIQLWVGPEGGFSDSEVTQVKSKGCTPVQLGPRVLRTETAALAAVASINTVWGDY
ncbi:MAG: 16S rRNA (uracil(1498)-N(3))-methyltransferase [Kangiellaceae bacterium]|nr:16S rRNA (uracil(1498)-N(3))-methyltransferase [Kangiellaceae bacterium]